MREEKDFTRYLNQPQPVSVEGLWHREDKHTDTVCVTVCVLQYMCDYVQSCMKVDFGKCLENKARVYISINFMQDICITLLSSSRTNQQCTTAQDTGA